MPFNNIEQPEIIEIEQGLRLKRFDGNIDKMVEGYHDPVVYQNSEGIFDQDKIPDVDYIKGMCKYLENVGELYFIQVLENGEYSSVGDVTVKAENPPIAIWQEKYRGVGIGSKVMKAVIDRLSFLGYKKIAGSSVFKWNTASQRMHERLGFFRVGETENDFIYEYIITEDYIIKPMETVDEIDGKGYVHYKSWQEAYTGLIDADYLENKMTLEKCISIAHKWTDNLLVAKDGEKVVGFAGYGKYRDDTLDDCGEVFSIYVLADYYGKKIGYELMNAAFKKLSAYSKIAVWVLKGNERAIRFYERYGFRFDGTEQEIMLGTPNTELRMIYERG